MPPCHAFGQSFDIPVLLQEPSLEGAGGLTASRALTMGLTRCPCFLRRGCWPQLVRCWAELPGQIRVSREEQEALGPQEAALRVVEAVF